jgi:hypothetical protein
MLNKALITVLTVMAIFIYAYTAECQAVRDGLVSFWTFDKSDVEGETVKDIVSGNDGTITGDPRTAQGKVGEALEFDGEDDYVKVLHSQDLDLQTNEATIEAWIYPNAIEADKHTIYRKADATDKFIFRLNGSNVEFYLETDAGPNNILAGNIEASMWQHVLGRYDGSNMEVFVDGISAGNVAHSGNIVSDAADVYIGSRPSDRRYNGLIDELRVYNRALSATEIRQNMNAQGFAVMTPTHKLAITWGKIKERN